MSSTKKNNLIIYDGVCNLCDFLYSIGVIDRDKNNCLCFMKLHGQNYAINKLVESDMKIMVIENFIVFKWYYL